METKCILVKLKPGSLPRVREWAHTLHTTRRAEALATLADEGVTLESVFLESRPDGDYLIYIMHARDMEKAHQVAKRSLHSIDAYHRKFKDETWESRTSAELLVDLWR
ncbi:MAG: hypothetical protein GC129_04040 [Proteobacteria bacterium]|nr:hypothetical protein [Pseudomonadota bacterium]